MFNLQISSTDNKFDYLGSFFLSKMPLLPKQKQVVQVVSLLVWKIRIFYKFPPSPNPRAATTTTAKATTTATTAATTSASTTPASSAPSTSCPATSRRARQATSTRSQTSGPPLEVNRRKKSLFLRDLWRHFLGIFSNCQNFNARLEKFF